MKKHRELLEDAYEEYLDWCSVQGVDAKDFDGFKRQLQEEEEIDKSIEKNQGRYV